MLACLVIPDFAAQVERRYAPTRAPLALIAGAQPVVAALDAQAGAWGVRRGMPLKRARALCPDIEVRPLVQSRLDEAFDAVLDQVRDIASRYEVQALAGGADPVCWLDLGTVSDAAARMGQLQHALRRTLQLQADLGGAQSKFPAFAAALAGTLTILPAGRECSFLAPLPVTWLPLMPDEARRLALYGLDTLGRLAALPRAAVMAQFGLRGRLLHQLACGEDPRPLQPYQPPPVLRVSRRFSEPLADEAQVQRVLRELAAEASARLSTSAAACSHLLLCLTDDTGRAAEQRQALREPLTGERDLFSAIRRLCALLPQTDVTALDLTVGALTAERPRQLSLFEEPATKRRTARQVARALRPRHGGAAFVRVVLPEQADLIPELATVAPLEDA